MKNMSGLLALVVAVIIGIVLVWIGNHLGLWWFTVLVGFAIGIFLRGVWKVLLAATLSGVGGWGLDLLWQSFRVDIGGAASVVSGIVGFGTSNGLVVILSALLLAWLLSLIGAWVGVALRRIVFDLRAYVYRLRQADSKAVQKREVAPSAGTVPVQTPEGGALTS